MAAKLQKLSTQHTKAAALLVHQSYSIREVADHLGVKVNTVYFWNADPLFKAYKRTLIHNQAGYAKELLESSLGTAVETLVSIAKDTSQEAKDRVSASKGIIDHALKLTPTEPSELVDMSEDEAIRYLASLPAHMLQRALALAHTPVSSSNGEK